MRALTIIHLLTWTFLPLSVFDSVAGWFTSAVSTAADVLKKVWGAVQTVWEFLVKVSNGEWNAWDWLVNGTEWLGKNIEDWAGAAYNAIGHVIFNVIPDAAKWALAQATKWAANAIRDVENWAKTAVRNAIKWVEGELHKVENKIVATAKSILKYVTGPIDWVIHVAVKWVTLVSHPELLAKYLVEHIALPLVRWMLRETEPLWVLMFKAFHSLSGDLLSFLEDIIEKVV